MRINIVLALLIVIASAFTAVQVDTVLELQAQAHERDLAVQQFTSWCVVVGDGSRATCEQLSGELEADYMRQLVICRARGEVNTLAYLECINDLLDDAIPAITG